MKMTNLLKLSLGMMFISVASAQVLEDITQVEEELSEGSNGRIVAAEVVGQVTSGRTGGDSKRTLATKDAVATSETVTAGDNSSVSLVFSNGAILLLEKNTALEIQKFLQDPFTTPYAVGVETEEPTTSQTKLNIVDGDFTLVAKKLNVDQGSSFEINTPVGAAGIRGTIVIGKKTANGYQITVPERKITFKLPGSNEVFTMKQGHSFTFVKNADGSYTIQRKTLGKQERRILLASVKARAAKTNNIVFSPGVGEVIIKPDRKKKPGSPTTINVGEITDSNP